MKAIIVTFCLNAFVLTGLFAQMQEVNLDAQKEVMKLDFLIGNWVGEGWMMMQDGKKHTFQQVEKIQYKLDKTAILIEGKGTAEGKVAHDALAVLTYDMEEQELSFTSFLFTGRSGKFKAELVDNKLYWFPNDYIRYIIWINEKGQWYEIGEMNRGGNWFQFFEATLDKK